MKGGSSRKQKFIVVTTVSSKYFASGTETSPLSGISQFCVKRKSSNSSAITCTINIFAR